ncbi:hypothetical protein JYK14_01210 [Siccirubricoccus sp. KC 17139]|uniref:(2Fe-2S)-binding protein n=1 Tax=Siccirubricoccus soli TaxID=2899147 RepID=A0ABT1CYS3_9PROT|nr:hypothetical protein [Siccirubricoccus soli]MCO6414799.1 hypothetical protein [Siccirubricoccus soli]MCP2680929.1 hypothetical protein [Siccirubricoccus soli]
MADVDMNVEDLFGDEGVAFKCGCRTLALTRDELIDRFGARCPVNHIGLRYTCDACKGPALTAWMTWPRVINEAYGQTRHKG